MSKKKNQKKSPEEKNVIGKLRSNILNLLEENPGRAWSIKQIVKKLVLKKRDDIKTATFLIYELEDDGKVKELPNGSYVSTQGGGETSGGGVTGIVDHVNPRFAYVRIGEDKKDVYIKTSDLGSAVDGDTVTVSVFSKRSGSNPEGRVTGVVKRGRTRYAGKVEMSKNFAFVVPDYRKMHQDFFINTEDINGAKTNDKVVVEVIEWASGEKNPIAKIVNVLGAAGENEAEIHSIMAEFGLPFEFPKKVEAEANKIEEGFTQEEIKKRWDFREILTFTIDPEDAKDFDDALSFEYLPDGYRIGVHIADVTHYVDPNSELEKEAFDRATSVYLVDRTIPMLPERLSNGLCSLRPKEDKFTFSAVFEMDKDANIKKEWFGRTVIHSDHRFSYEGAQAVLETKQGPFAKELNLLNDLAHKLRKERFKQGAVNFETTEVKFKLDEKGKPLAVIPKVRKDAHKLIEEFMLLANKQVARFIYNMKKGEERNTFVYRTHDNPDPEKLQNFSMFAKQFGHKLNVEGSGVSRSLNKLMDEIEGKPEQNVLQSLAVRAMAKAKYTTEAKGHFGLAFDHYSHFTSPIRRYPDMMVHRLLQHYLDKGKSVNKKDFEEKSLHSSEREKRAADAERASIKYKQVEYMAMMDKSRVYDGIISGVTEWGIFIEIIETKCEGMIRLADMEDDFYEFDEKSYSVIGRRRRKIYTLGDQVRVKIKKTDVDKRTIDLVFAREVSSVQ
jgi:ribonuclease R